MKKENFKNLLTDLYNIYNKGNLIYVDDLVERYNRLEFESVRNIFIKYNNKTAKHYNPNIGTDEYIYNLIQEYEQGNRSLQSVDLKAEAINQKNSQEKNEVLIKEKELKENFSSEIQKATEELQKQFQQEIQNYQQQIESYKNQIKDITENKKEVPEAIYRVFSNNAEINLPNKKYLSTLGKGARIITFDENKKVVGLEITDITIDYISHQDNIPIIEITVEHA